MGLESSKTLGGIGALLIVIGSLGIIAHGVIGILGLVGIILILIAMKGLSEYYKEEGIFSNVLYGFILTIVGGVISVVILVASFLVLLTTEFWTIFENFQWTNWQDFWILIRPIVVPIIIAGVVFIIFHVITALLYRKSLSILAEKSSEKMFDTAGLLMLIGAVLTIVLVGGIVTVIAWILVAVGFFSIKIPAAPPPAPSPPQAPTVPLEKIYCRYCGTENKSDAIFCKKCGKKIAED